MHMTASHTQREPISILLSPLELERRLRAIGEERYHHRHPFHLRMHEGRLTRGQLQTWALNRFYYQSRVPIKDAVILSRCEDVRFRRAWRSRIEDHDGAPGRPGGIERWLQLTEATGLRREVVLEGCGVLPAVRFAVDAYVQLVRERTFLEAVASSLTEMFAGSLIALRLDAMRRHYPWMAGSLDYFETRLTQAPQDARFALDWVQRNTHSPEDQERACRALEAKCDILWAQLDALYFAYVEPAWPAPGAFIPEAG
jgi:pyrroloquinoline-quinone synthase